MAGPGWAGEKGAEGAGAGAGGRRRAGLLFKFTKPGLYGAQVDDAGAYLQRWALSNRVFGDAARFEGYVTLPGESEPRAVVSQPFVPGRDASREEIESFLLRRGFVEVESYWVHAILGVAIWDASTPGNAIVRKPDGAVVPVDFSLLPATSWQMQAAGRGRGAGRCLR